jgi:hypothetical protein
MLSDRFRGLLSFSRRRKPKTDARVEDHPGIVPPVSLPKEEAGVTIHVHTLSVSRLHQARGNGSDIFDYVLGLLIIGLLVLGGTLWSSRNGRPTESSLSLSPLTWTRRDATSGGALTTPTSRASEKRRSDLPAQGSNTTEEVPVADRPPLPIRIVPASYTDEARNAGFHGKVFVTIFVDALGVPEKIEATSPIPFGLEHPIRQAVLQWRFQPALSRASVAVASKTVVEVPFR